MMFTSEKNPTHPLGNTDFIKSFQEISNFPQETVAKFVKKYVENYDKTLEITLGLRERIISNKLYQKEIPLPSSMKEPIVLNQNRLESKRELIKINQKALSKDQDQVIPSGFVEGFLSKDQMNLPQPSELILEKKKLETESISPAKGLPARSPPVIFNQRESSQKKPISEIKPVTSDIGPSKILLPKSSIPHYVDPIQEEEVKVPKPPPKLIENPIDLQFTELKKEKSEKYLKHVKPQVSNILPKPVSAPNPFAMQKAKPIKSEFPKTSVKTQIIPSTIPNFLPQSPINLAPIRKSPERNKFRHMPIENNSPIALRPRNIIESEEDSSLTYERLLKLDEAEYDMGKGFSTIELSRILQISLFKGAAEKISCNICLEIFKFGDECCWLICQHPFHYACISNWLSRKRSCPLKCENIFD